MEDAFRLAAGASREALLSCDPNPAEGRSPGHILIAAALSQYDGDVDRAIALLRRALATAPTQHRHFVVELLAPICVMRRDLDSLAELLERRPGETPFLATHVALETVAAALRSENARCLELSAHTRALLEDCDDDLMRARALQRLALAAYYTGRTDEAMSTSLESARLFESLGAFRLLASAYSIVYNICHSVTGDVERAYESASKMGWAAQASGDRSFALGSLVAQYEIAAELADEALLAGLRARLRERPLPAQYQESFALGLAELLPLAWKSDFAAFRSGIDVLAGVAGRSPAERSLALALQAMAEAALEERAAARRFARQALSIVGTHGASAGAPYELRYKRLARLIASSACILVSDVVRGRRALAVSLLRGSLESDLARVVDGLGWRDVPHRVRGYARLIAAARDAVAKAQRVQLTRPELEVLRLFADGKSAPEIARETDRSVYTIRAHARSIFSKLDAHGRSQAIARARGAGLLP